MHKVKIRMCNAKSDREEWLALRRQCITATDWPKITGTSRWGTATDVILDKQTCAPDYESEIPLPMRVGTALEPLIIERVRKTWGGGEPGSVNV